MRSLIPNLFTSSNLIFGVLSIVKTFEKDFFTAAIFIVMALIADAFDGRTARFFGVDGDFGKELDSLCDVVSFGVSPAILIYNMYLLPLGYIALIPIAIFPVCAAFRLARFNISTDSVQGYFMGLPAPAGGCILATFAIASLDIMPEIVAIGVVIYGLLMYSTVRYPDFKGKGNPIRKFSSVLAVVLAAYLLYALPVIAIPFILFFSYTVMGLVNFLYVKFTGGYES